MIITPHSCYWWPFLRLCPLLWIALLGWEVGAAEVRPDPTITLSGSGVTLSFNYTRNRLALSQIQRAGEPPLLYEDIGTQRAGAGPVGNPMAVVIREGKFASTNGMASFRVIELHRTEQRLRAYLEHDVIPMQIGMEITVEGSVVKWLGQALWNGDEPVEAEIFFPLLSRMRFDSPKTDRAITPQISGSVRAPLGEVNYAQNYVGRFASPVFLVEGGGRGMAWLDDNRADYFFPAQHFGGFETIRPGVEALHRAGGRLMYYIEGMIVWKRSRIGRSVGSDWALMEPDGRLTEHYRGFYHACPAYRPYQEWLARTCAQILQTTGIDGFFLDSSLATYNHRCFNPAHRHPHPDVWTWGIRQMLQRVREECDKVNPEAVLLVEGCGDIGREFGDGFVAHSHFWNEGTFTEPLVRFLHPDMRGYESWGYTPRGGTTETLKRWFIWNSVQGYRAYAHNAAREEMASLSRQVRRYYDSFPEICDSPMSQLDVETENGIAQLFDGPPRVLTVGNPTSQEAEVSITFPVSTSVLLDRTDGMRVSLTNQTAKLKLQPWQYRAFELKP